MMKKSHLRRLACLAVSAVVLGSALAVAAVNGSPYEALKRSLFDLGQADNLTLKTDAVLLLDGREVETSSETLWQGGGKKLTVSKDHTNFNSEAFNLNSWRGFEDGGDWYSAQSPGNEPAYALYGGGFFGAVSGSGAQSRFIELVLDLLVGDLKNNISMSQDGDRRYVSGTLTETQIPELYNAAVDLFATESNSRSWVSGDEVVSFNYEESTCVTRYVWLSGLEKISEYTEHDVVESENPEVNGYGLEYGGRYYDIVGSRLLRTETEPATEADYADVTSGRSYDLLPLSGARLTYVHGEGELDAEGRLRALSGTVCVALTDVFGKHSELELRFSLEASDYGTTDPQCPVPGVQELLDQYPHENARYANIRFKLAPDGTIDTSSVFDMMSPEATKALQQEKEAAGVPADQPAGEPDEDPADEPAETP